MIIIKDYSNYRNPPVDKLKWSGQKIFEKQLAYEGIDIAINGTGVRVIVRNHGNPTNEFKEERYIISGKDIGIKRGYYIEYEGENYIIVTDIDKENPFYNTSMMQKCNNTLTWKNEYGKKFNYPCIVSSQTLYSVGMDVEDISIGSEKIEVIVGRNDKTLSISRDDRFRFDGTVYEVTYIDSITQQGLLKFKMQEYSSSSTGQKDNVWAIDITNSVTQLEIDKPIKLNADVYKNNILQENEEVLWEVSDDTIANIDSDGNLTGISVGNLIVTCSLANNPDIKNAVAINVTEDIVEPMVNYGLQGDSELHWTEVKTYVASKYIDGLEDASATWTFEITSDPNNVAKITSTTDTSCDITYEQLERGAFTLTTTCSDGKVLNKDIEMLGF